MALSNEQKAAIKAAVQSDSVLSTAWARAGNKPTGEVANALNAADQSVDVDARAVDARRIVLPTGEYASVKVLSETRPATPAVYAAITFVATLDDRDAVIPASAKDGTSTMLGALVSANALSTISRDAMMALFIGKSSRAQQIVGSPISEGDLLDAMK